MDYSSRAVFLFAIILISSSISSSATRVSHDGRAILINGKRRLLLSGSIHYPRSTPEMWHDLIHKAKEGGLDAIETYVFWNAHEPNPRQYNFEGNLNLVRFLKEVHNAGLYAVLRIGPYVCAEWNYGGLPVWLREIPGLQFRTNNQPFKDEMERFTRYIVDMVKKEKLLAPQGGPIILTQIENEYGNAEDKYGDAGKEYVKWCAKMANSLNVGVPWIMCQQPDAPQPMINTCNGFYCNEFNPNNKNSPKMWTENWTGWFKAWDKPDEHRPAEDLAYSVARFFQSNGTFQNYYMYHGGTNFGRTAGGPYISTTYDYDAPLDEYGYIRQPKWGHLKDLHTALKSMEHALVYGDVKWTDLGNGLSLTRFSGEGVTPACFLTNKNQSAAAAAVDHEGSKFFLPAWSMSFLPDCKKEVYNTAKVNAQTSVMTKKPNQAEQQPASLKWSWRFEDLDGNLNGLNASFIENRLLEQIKTSVDASDYLWYTASFDSYQEQMTLRVNTTGHVLYAFVNSQLVGSQHSTHEGDKIHPFVFERNITLNKGKNQLSLLSATVGLKNYDPYYELVPAGIVSGPVQLLGGNITMDLSQAAWSYKVGLDGFKSQLYLQNNLDDSVGLQWASGSKTPTNRPFIWYKTTFLAPLGSEPVAVDLLGLGKGEAWVNGQSIGRYWPSYIASTPEKGCDTCDYRGPFEAGKCVSGCGEPAQRWYHVPRSFLKAGKPNTLTLFEEAGGDPSQVNFQTVVVGKICSNVEEGKNLTLSCQGYGRKISSIDFACFDTSEVTCGSYNKVKCVSDALSIVQNACLGKESCSIEATKRLAVQATCQEPSLIV